jgi:hypothetical protein
LGGGGGGMAYAGMVQSAAVLFNIYNQSGITFGTNGVAGTYTPTAPVGLTNGNPIQIDIHYAGSILSVTLSNTVTADVFTTNIVVGSLAAAVGTNVAFVGITAATGGISSVQQVNNFQFVPIPLASAQNAGGTVKVLWPASVGGFGVQSGSNLTAPVWTDLGVPITQANGYNQATVSPTNNAAFYRLMIVPTP